MSRIIKFRVPGLPIAKGRPRIGTIGGKARAFTPEKTVAFEGLVALAGQNAMMARPPLEGPLDVRILSIFPIPQSWSRKKREAAKWHTSRPDGDNLGKAIGDGLNGVCWVDDSQLAVTTIIKQYGEQPYTEITITPLYDDPALTELQF